MRSRTQRLSKPKSSARFAAVTSPSGPTAEPTCGSANPKRIKPPCMIHLDSSPGHIKTYGGLVIFHLIWTASPYDCLTEFPFGLPGRHRGVTASPGHAPGTIHFFPYFFLKRSMRPFVSRTCCLPVKNGCDADDISTMIKVIAIPNTSKWYSNPSPFWLPYQFMKKPCGQ